MLHDDTHILLQQSITNMSEVCLTDKLLQSSEQKVSLMTEKYLPGTVNTNEKGLVTRPEA